MSLSLGLKPSSWRHTTTAEPTERPERTNELLTIKTTVMFGIILAIVGGFLAALLDAVRK